MGGTAVARETSLGLRPVGNWSNMDRFRFGCGVQPCAGQAERALNANAPRRKWSPGYVITYFEPRTDGRSHLAWADHLFRPHQGVELGIGDIAAADRLLAQGGAVLVRGLGDLGRRVVANLRRQRR